MMRRTLRRIARALPAQQRRAVAARLLTYRTYKTELGPFLQSRASVWLPTAAVTDATKLQGALTSALAAIADEAQEQELEVLMADDGAIAAACENVKQRALAEEDVGLDARYFDVTGARGGTHGTTGPGGVSGDARGAV
jgi:hypothetical protein